MNGGSEENTQIFTKGERKHYVPRSLKILLSIPAVVIDGLIVMLIAFLTAINTGVATIISVFSNDTTYKYVDAATVFWTIITLQVLSILCGATAASLVGLQSYRNKVFAEHAAQKQAALVNKQEKEEKVV